MALLPVVGLSATLLPATALSGASDELKTLSRSGDGGPVCGLGAEFHAGRRVELRRRVETGWMFFRGLPAPRGATAFRQDKQFWYLTGIESPDVSLLMDAESGREVLFLPAHSARGERWNGELWDASDEWVKELTGFAEVRSNDELMEVLGEVLESATRVWTSSHPTLAMSGNERLRREVRTRVRPRTRSTADRAAPPRSASASRNTSRSKSRTVGST